MEKSVAASLLASQMIFAQAVSAEQHDLAEEPSLPIDPPAQALSNLSEPSLPPDEDFVFRSVHQNELTIADKAFPKMAAKWKSTSLFVCWEDMDPRFENDREIVKQAIADTWERVSALQFKWQGKCPENAADIRIAVADVGPHTKGLGNELDGVPGGMVLNFEYRLWSTACQQNKRACTRMFAIHEFGHAIGFAHEQNRTDASEDCKAENRAAGPEGDTQDLTPWDPNSIMNYCAVPPLNDGQLSAFDIEATQKIYGEGANQEVQN